MNNEIIIRIEHVTKRYPVGEKDFTALKDINLQFKKGEFTGMVRAKRFGEDYFTQYHWFIGQSDRRQGNGDGTKYIRAFAQRICTVA